MTDLGAALWVSVQAAGLGTAVAAPIAIPLGFALARLEFRGKALVEALVALPLVLPPIVTGYGLLVLFGRGGVFPTSVAFTTTACAIAAGVMGLPLFVRTLRVAFEAVEPGLEQAAMTLGCTPAQAFWRVTLPLAFPGVVAGALLCFARALGEFGATVTFAGNIQGETRTLTLAIWSALQSPGGERDAAMLVGLSAVLAIGAVTVGELLVRRARSRLAA
ncbi:MAG: molybdate ABC transporter permease subunit [Proteobacteria bacterium]|nr:molybdate ABC transporter permease subunit [Pseudomonadota bacterium]MCP4920100.1 molybdate ABC transporter permease subunit [Pseudomonadota bacterium]